MFGTKEVETKVTDVLKHIADDTVKKVGKKHNY